VIRAAISSSNREQHMNEEPAVDSVGAAEAEVGRYVYRLIEARMDAAAGTAEGAELEYLAALVSDVEEYGAHDLGDDELCATPGSPHFGKLLSKVAILTEALEASQHAEAALRGEVIQLRNEVAQRRGQDVAAAHAAGRPAP